MDAEFREAERVCMDNPNGENLIRYLSFARRSGRLRDAKEKLMDHIHKVEGFNRIVVIIGVGLIAEMVGSGPVEMRSQKRGGP